MRYERKYRILDQSFAFVRQMIHHHPRGFRPIYPDRQVNNIYFDTPHLQCYKDNVDGLASRRKYRIRWYGALDATNTTKNQLEIKLKENTLGDKKTYLFPSFKLADWTDLGPLVCQTLSTPLVLQPTLLNAYQRSYYGIPNGKFRITIDRELGYSPLLKEGRLPAIRYADPGIIVEVKYEEGVEQEANEILQYLPFRMTKNSKYVSGMEVRNVD